MSERERERESECEKNLVRYRDLRISTIQLFISVRVIVCYMIFALHIHVRVL